MRKFGSKACMLAHHVLACHGPAMHGYFIKRLTNYVCAHLQSDLEFLKKKKEVRLLRSWDLSGGLGVFGTRGKASYITHLNLAQQSCHCCRRKRL